MLAACGMPLAMNDLVGASGRQLLQRVHIPPAFAALIGSVRRLIDALDFENALFTNRPLVAYRPILDPDASTRRAQTWRRNRKERSRSQERA